MRTGPSARNLIKSKAKPRTSKAFPIQKAFLPSKVSAFFLEAYALHIMLQTTTLLFQGPVPLNCFALKRSTYNA